MCHLIFLIMSPTDLFVKRSLKKGSFVNWIMCFTQSKWNQFATDCCCYNANLWLVIQIHSVLFDRMEMLRRKPGGRRSEETSLKQRKNACYCVHANCSRESNACRHARLGSLQTCRLLLIFQPPVGVQTSRPHVDDVTAAHASRPSLKIWPHNKQVGGKAC